MTTQDAVRRCGSGETCQRFDLTEQEDQSGDLSQIHPHRRNSPTLEKTNIRYLAMGTK